LVEKIKSLKRDVMRYKVDNEKLMKSQEKQNGFNIKLLQSLDIIEKKVDKETKSSKSKDHRSHAKNEEYSNFGRHNHYSPRHLVIRAHISPILSPIRKNNKRFWVDELQGEMNKIKIPTFDGEKMKDEDGETWLLGIRKYFKLHNYSSQAEGIIAIYQLKRKSLMWWE
jgi:hypothetical protein